MTKLIILTGISGSGKSTYAKKYVLEHSDTLIINRDSLIESLTGIKASIYNKTPRRMIEHTINSIQESILNQFKYDVIVDNTNLTLKYVTLLKNKWKEYNPEGTIEHIFIECPIWEARTRVQDRDSCYIGDTEYIVAQEKLLHELHLHTSYDKIIKYE